MSKTVSKSALCPGHADSEQEKQVREKTQLLHAYSSRGRRKASQQMLQGSCFLLIWLKLRSTREKSVGTRQHTVCRAYVFSQPNYRCLVASPRPPDLSCFFAESRHLHHHVSEFAVCFQWLGSLKHRNRRVIDTRSTNACLAGISSSAIRSSTDPLPNWLPTQASPASGGQSRRESDESRNSSLDQTCS